MSRKAEPLWSIDDLAAFLAVPKQTIYAWRVINYGPPGFRVGRFVRYRAEDVQDWARRQAQDQGQDRQP